MANFDLSKLNDAELTALHEQTSTAVRAKKLIQIEDIKVGMSPEDMKRAEQAILAALPK